MTSTRSRAVRTRGGLSVRLDVRTFTVVVLLLVAALAASVVLIGTGDFPIPAADVLKTLVGNGNAGQEFIVNDLRLPRVLVGLLVGASLGLGGALFQSISRNPLGSPDVLGLGQGSTAGALIMIVLFSGSARPGRAGSARRWPGDRARHLSARLEAGGARIPTGPGRYRGLRDRHGGRRLSADQSGHRRRSRCRSRLDDRLPGDGRDWAQVWPLLALCAVLVPLVLGNARGLRMMEMGDDVSYALGVRVERVRLLLMLAAVLLTAGATAAAAGRLRGAHLAAASPGG